MLKLFSILYDVWDESKHAYILLQIHFSQNKTISLHLNINRFFSYNVYIIVFFRISKLTLLIDVNYDGLLHLHVI